LKNSQTFAISSDLYAQFRPQYPEELFAFLAGLCPAHDRAWDCATGNGQAAVAIASYFSIVEATDISREQVKNSLRHPHVHYSVSPSEKTSFAENSFDLITVAQAIHWFDLPNFFHEVNRILKPDGILAIMGYSSIHVDPQIDRILSDGFYDSIDTYWAHGNRQLMDEYRSLTLPFPEIPSSRRFDIKVNWNLPHFLGYLSTWSAVKRYIAERGTDPLRPLQDALSVVWHHPDEIREVSMPVALKVCRKPA
jgi:ubiquinone/menaquinone biosynthesis C-methylase UbiE